MIKTYLVKISKTSLCILGSLLGIITGILSYVLLTKIYRGYWWFVVASPGEPGAGGFEETFFYSMKYYPFAHYFSFLIFIIMGIIIGSILLSYKITLIRLIPILPYLSLIIAGIGSLLITQRQEISSGVLIVDGQEFRNIDIIRDEQFLFLSITILRTFLRDKKLVSC